MENIELSVLEIKKYILKYYLFYCKGQINISNQAFWEYTNGICKLIYDSKSYDFLYDLLNDNFCTIQTVGAYFLLPLKPYKAICKLIYICFNKDIEVSDNAKHILSEWFGNRLKFPIWNSEHNKVEYVDRKVYIKTLITHRN